MESTEIIPHEHNAFTRFLFSRPIVPIPEQREETKLHKYSFSRFMWIWVGGILRRGYDRVIVPRDIPYIAEDESIHRRFDSYKRFLGRHPPSSKTKYRELIAVVYAMRWRLAFAFILKLITAGSQVGMSIISRKLIEYAEKFTQEHKIDQATLVGYILGTCIMDVVSLVSDLYAVYMGLMNGEYCRTLMMACIHDKMLRLGPQQRHDYSAAKIMTISSSDCRRTSTVFMEVNAVLVLPFYMGASIGVLIYMLGISGLAGVGLLVVGLIFSIVFSIYVADLRMSSMPYQDQRVSITRETLKNMSIVKFYGWEDSFLKLVKSIRAVETKYIRLIEMVDAINMAVITAVPNLAGALSFGVKIAISSNLKPEQAFPSLILFQIFGPLFTEVSFALQSMADAFVAVKRLDKFFRLPELPSYIEPLGSEDPDMVAKVEDGTFSWTLGAEVDIEEDVDEGEFKTTEKKVTPSVETVTEKLVLENVNFYLKQGTMTLVVGSVGSGKTSLLSILANLVPKKTGSVKISKSLKVTSVLSLWCQNCSVRDNILFGDQWDAAKYHEVVRMCDLKSDFDLFPYGDHTEIGENGVTLSGGQCARLALARCLYADGDLIILDDILSAMDGCVANHIYRELLSLVRDKGKTILFSTNNLKLIPHSDFVIVLDGKCGATQYTPQTYKLPEHFTITRSQPASDEDQSFATDDSDGPSHDSKTKVTVHSESKSDILISEKSRNTSTHSSTGFLNDFPSDSKTLVNREKNDRRVSTEDVVYLQPSGDIEMNGGYAVTSQMDEELRSTGTVDLYVIMRYFRLNTPVGILLAIILLITVICYATSEALSTVILSWWTSNEFHKSQGFNLGMYILDVVLVAVFYTIFSNVLSFISTASSTKLHNLALAGLYKAPISYFHSNPLGRLLMRFTEDLVNLDVRLIAFARMTFMSLFSMIASVMVIFVKVPWSILCLLPIFILTFILVNFYRTSSRELNRCQQLFDSRGMATVSDHIEGQEVIIAFGRAEHAQSTLNQRMDDVVSVIMHNEAANFWMASWSGVMCEVLNLVTIFLVCFQVFSLNASEVGMLISILLMVRNNLTLFLPMYALFDNQLTSVERLDEYVTKVPREGESVSEKENPKLIDWTPTTGEICFNHVGLRYRNDHPLVLNDFCIRIGGGKKIGICGRTGAGKSTIITALFRLTELAEGSILIDGQDISELPLSALRRALAIIPQQPVLFQGTIRSNLDPFGEHSDEILLNALEHAGLTVGDRNCSLSDVVAAEGSNYSLGQRQMLALCRTIVRNSKILVLDEATAAIDMSTDRYIQQTIKTVFSDCTVLCIAHRLETILDYDEIIVMGSGGRLLDMGPPRSLWEKTDGPFRQMCNASGVHFD